MEKHLTLKQKDHAARKIYKTYQRAQLDILYLNQHYNYYPQVDMFKVKDTSSSYHNGDEKMIKQLERKQKLESFVGIIHQIHNHLSKDTYEFIEHEYINYYQASWWMSFYSRASYYRMKHRALDEFIECIQIFWSEEEILSLLES